MLVLTRRTGETVIIGEEIMITVTAIKGKRVDLGITAPKNITVHREEVYERIRSRQRRTGNRQRSVAGC